MSAATPTPRRETVYVSVAETAKLVRAALKAAFPGITFSVRSKSYSMGASISVRWTDGPAAYGTCRARFVPSRAAAPAEGDDNGGQLPLFGDTNG